MKFSLFGFGKKKEIPTPDPLLTPQTIDPALEKILEQPAIEKSEKAPFVVPTPKVGERDIGPSAQVLAPSIFSRLEDLALHQPVTHQPLTQQPVTPAPALQTPEVPEVQEVTVAPAVAAEPAVAAVPAEPAVPAPSEPVGEQAPAPSEDAFIEADATPIKDQANVSPSTPQAEPAPEPTSALETQTDSETDPQAILEMVAQQSLASPLTQTDSSAPSQTEGLVTTREDVIAAYKIFLGRIPESEQAIAAWTGLPAPRLLIDFLVSNEFLGNADKVQFIVNLAKKIVQVQAQAAEKNASPETQSASSNTTASEVSNP